MQLTATCMSNYSFGMGLIRKSDQDAVSPDLGTPCYELDEVFEVYNKYKKRSMKYTMCNNVLS